MRWMAAARKSELNVRNFETSAQRFARYGRSPGRNAQRPAKNAQRPARNAHRHGKNVQRIGRSVQRLVGSARRSGTNARTSVKSARKLEKYSPMTATLLCMGQMCEALAAGVRGPLVNPETNFLLLVEDLGILIPFLGEGPGKLNVSLLMNTAYLRKQVAHAMGSTGKYGAHSLWPP